MWRRDFLGSLLFQSAHPRINYRDYSRCFPDFLRTLAQQAYERRNRDLAALTTPQAIRDRQNYVRRTFWSLIGGEPQRTPLNARVTGSFERDAYRVEKVVYESRPELHIPANLYIPKSGKPPYPGVLFQLGHSLNGKASGLYQYCCQGLAQLGYVVLSFDTMGQGERTYYPGPNGLTRLGSADDEHTLPGKQLLLTGDTSSRLQVWDAVRSLDYLASHPFVDPKRLASTGNSGGGTLTMLLAAVDDRLACAAPACPNSENHAVADFNSPGSTDDAEQDLLDSARYGIDRWDLFYPLAPKPLLILVSAKDFFGTYSPRYIQNGREEFDKLRKVYSALGKPDHLAWYETPLPHGLSYDLRLEIYRWFQRHLQPGAPPVEKEPPVRVETDETLWVTRTGNVVTELSGITPHRMALQRAAAITTPSHAPNLPALLHLQPQTKPSVIQLGQVASRQAIAESIEVTSAPGVWVPAWLFLPPAPRTAADPLIVVLEPAGRNARWNEDSLYQQIAAAGRAVCSPDLRGIGDLNPEFPRHAPRHAQPHQQEEHYAWASLMLGVPLLGQRVDDILALVRALADYPSTRGRRIALAASGKMTVPALFAAAIESSISSVYLAGGLLSFRNIVDHPHPTHPFANYLFDVLRHTDLPQLAASLAPRSVTLGGCVDAAGRRLPADQIRGTYSAANVTVLSEPAWDLAAFSRL
jgi:cephalosporin-C deacetylase-like acetyl esterase